MMLTHRLSVLAHDLSNQCHMGTEQEDMCTINGRKRPLSFETSKGMDFKEERRLYDHYEKGESIGNGGFGSVYAGTCKETGNSVAIKEIPKGNVFGWSKIGNKVVPKEVALLHNLQQKYIIRMLDHFENDDKFYIVMERPEKYIDLFDYITQKGTVSERSSRYLFRQVVEAVQYCLSMGVLHRDVKDENILIDLNSNQVKLIDFGSGTFLQDSVYTEYEGTKVYCPPEWVLKHRYHAIPATVWSLGILLYNMLLGDVPYEKESDIVSAQLSFHISISRDAESLIRWMLSFWPKDRPTIEQIFKHPWMKSSSSSATTTTTTTSTTASSKAKPCSFPASRTLNSSSSLCSSDSCSSYHRSPSCCKNHTHFSTSRTPPTTRQSSRQVSDVSASPCTPTTHIQTRSQTRLNKGKPSSGLPSMSPSCSLHHTSLGSSGGSVGSREAARACFQSPCSRLSACSDKLDPFSPKTPLMQVRKGRSGSQVTRK